MPKQYRVQLSEAERQQLQQLVASGSAAARVFTHAHILLKADESPGGPAWTDAQIVQALEISGMTAWRVRKRYVEGGMAAALERKVQQNRRKRRLDGAAEAHLIALACGPAPEGRARWTVRLLADKLVELGHAEELSHDTVWRTLKKGSSSPG